MIPRALRRKTVAISTRAIRMPALSISIVTALSLWLSEPVSGPCRYIIHVLRWLRILQKWSREEVCIVCGPAEMPIDLPVHLDRWLGAYVPRPARAGWTDQSNL